MKKVQYFIPKSKKRRIQKKAAKLYIKLVPDTDTVIVDHINRVMYCHPIIEDKLRRSIYLRKASVSVGDKSYTGKDVFINGVYP